MKHKKKDDYVQNDLKYRAVGGIHTLIDITPEEFPVKGKACINNTTYEVKLPFGYHRNVSAGAPREKKKSDNIG